MGDDLRGILHLLRERPPRVVVAGDAILDRWLRGDVRRLSREAPVPVVDAAEPEECAGGAANTAVNLAALGASVRLIAAVGDDSDGERLLALLRRAGVDTSGVLVRPGATASKTRVVGDGQIVVRVDSGSGEELSARDRGRVREALTGVAGDETLLVCDYGAGLLDDSAVAALADAPRPAQLLVDAHDLGRWRPARPDVVTPNSGETSALLGRHLPQGAVRVAAVTDAAPHVLAASGAAAAVVTLDRDGTVVIDAAGRVHRTHAHPVPEHQATGAGDTFAAALAVATALGAELPRAAAFAQRAADVVVARPGTAVCTLDALEAAITGTGAPRAVGLEALRAALAEQSGRTVVFTNGCFDVLHLGHTTHLQQAKALGDVLVVALNDDDSVRRLKGPGRPINPLEDRARVLEALGCVDHVVVFSEDSPSRLLAELRPQIYAKGGDYTAEMLEETPVVRSYCGEVRILDFIPAHSTTEVVNRIAQGAPLR
ncbi:D-glycero-beta-D-manno-heptose 1-phosphate adenylyltransferase [Microbacterium sp. LRZ72]|uniref:D-glycero-beta-D-manno-heptose 1-phosphate adenylyltransferase n=1 Tax=Microbacterium sp. LRZ72 TaxID=2942481 RepID=UPI0029BE1420|nr:D-glycero-beta-D-manno-heptose 1-phosphate adenylyltransferase [Microbacterium sp. LRZ72]MDX2376729.1 D-glycero-beta-D-manno-heptose 1-phosphate adenylyltransferase [Microbacterium sp. LRZ72]